MGTGVGGGGGGSSLVITVLLKLTRGATGAELPEDDLDKETSAWCDLRIPEEDLSIPLDGADPFPDMISEEDFLMPRAGGDTIMPRLLHDKPSHQNNIYIDSSIGSKDYK